MSITDRWQAPKLGWGFAMLAVTSYLFIPLGRTMFRTWRLARTAPRGPYRVIAVWLGILALVVNFGWVPLPYRVACHGSIRPANPSLVYTQVAGRLAVRSLPTEQPLNATEPLAVLENAWIEDRCRVAAQRQQELECKLASTRHSSYQAASAIDRLPSLKVLLSIAQKQVKQAESERDLLKVRATEGREWIPTELPPLETLDVHDSHRKSETVIHAANQGRWIPAGTPIGYCVSSDAIALDMVLPVSKLEAIAVGMTARVRFDQLPHHLFRARVEGISDKIATDPYRPSMADGSLNDRSEDERVSYVSVTLLVDGASRKMLAMGGTAEVVIWSRPKSLYQHALHLAGATFGPTASRTISR
jgi:hypothetical protein